MIVAAYILSFLILFATFAPMFKAKDNKGATGVIESAALPQPIPPGFQIYVKNVPLAGSNYRRKNKLAFAESSNHTLRLEPEPDNPKDPNAIQVIGDCADDDYVLGYLPKDMAAQVIQSGLLNQIQPRLMRIYIGERGDGYVEIWFQLIGPKAEKKTFDQYSSLRSA